MAHVTRQEVRKIASISTIAIEEEDLDALIHRLQEVLDYAECVKEVATTLEYYEEIRQRNIMRRDTTYRTDSALLLAQAPCQEEQYFIVPKVLNSR